MHKKPKLYAYHLNPVMLVFIWKFFAKYYKMSTHAQGFPSFLRFLSQCHIDQISHQHKG